MDTSVAVCESDPNIRSSLSAAIRRCGFEGVVWESDGLADIVGQDRVRIAFVNADLLKASDSATLKGIDTPVIYNSRRYRHLVTQVSQGVVITRLDYYLTPDIVQRDFGIQLGLTAAKGLRLPIRRSSAAAKDEYADIVGKRDECTPPLVSSFLRFIQRGIHTDLERLRSDFSFSSSDARPIPRGPFPEKAPSSVQQVESYLRNFMRDGNSSRRGCFLVGEAGAGKTTLAHYVGLTEDACDTCCFVAIDYTLVPSREMFRGHLVALANDLCRLLPGNKLPDFAADFPHAAIIEIPRIVKTIFATGAYHLVETPGPETLEAIRSQIDRATLVEMYAYFSKHGRSPEELGLGSTMRVELIDEAEDWLNERMKRPNELLVDYLYFAFSVGWRDSFEAFSFRGILRFLLGHPTRTDQIAAARDRVLAGIDLQEKVVELLHGERRSQWDAIAMMSLSELQQVSFGLIDSFAEDRPVVLLLDNIDQKPSAELEASAVANALVLFGTFSQRYDTCRAVLCMRAETYELQRWIESVAGEWAKTEVMSADFKDVLTRRARTWQRIGDGVGYGSAYAFTEDLVALVESTRLGRRGEKRDHPLIDIVRHRHPHNVRQQLRVFAECVENALIQGKAYGRSQQGRWVNRSYEFFLRAFLLRDRRFFREAASEVINVYDNGRPSCAFNAVIRCWLLRCAPKGVFSDAELTEPFCAANIPRDALTEAVACFLRAGIFEGSPEGRLQTSEWGDYFRDRFAFDLPYISVVWWTTAMHEDYSLGPPQAPLASELERYASIFLRWLRAEQEYCWNVVGDRKNALIDAFGAPNLDVWEAVSAEISFSLNSIDRCLERLPPYFFGKGHD